MNVLTFFKKHKWPILLLVFLSLFRVFEYLFDLIFSDGDGYILKYNLHYVLLLVQITGFLFLTQWILVSSRIKWLHATGELFRQVLVFILIWLLVEGVFYLVNRNNEGASKNFTLNQSGRYYTPDHELGYKALPGNRSKVVFGMEGRLPDTVDYCIDDLGARTDCGSGNLPETGKKHALFMGCSVTFGVLTPDSMTLPVFFERAQNKYHAYNFGMSGYGPQQVYLMLKSRVEPKSIKEEDGIAVYTYLGDGHVLRAVGDMQEYAHFLQLHPWFELENGKPVYKGRFIDRPVSAVYGLLGMSQVLKFFHINFPSRLNERHFRLTASLINAAKDSYKQRFGGGTFYLLLWPGTDRHVLPYLDNDMVVLDYTRLIPGYPVKPYIIEGEGHPNAMAYKRVAQQMRADIK